MDVIYVLKHESGSEVRFKNLFTAARNALNNHRDSVNGWKLVDLGGIEYPEEDWKLLAELGKDEEPPVQEAFAATIADYSDLIAKVKASIKIAEDDIRQAIKDRLRALENKNPGFLFYANVEDLWSRCYNEQGDEICSSVDEKVTIHSIPTLL